MTGNIALILARHPKHDCIIEGFPCVCVCVCVCVCGRKSKHPLWLLLKDPLRRVTKTHTHTHTHTLHAGKKMPHSLRSHRKFCSRLPFPACPTLTLTHTYTDTHTHSPTSSIRIYIKVHVFGECGSVVRESIFNAVILNFFRFFSLESN